MLSPRSLFFLRKKKKHPSVFQTWLIIECFPYVTSHIPTLLRTCRDRPMYVCMHACMYVYIYPSISSMFLGVKILVQRGAKTIIKALLTEYCLCKVYFRPGVHLFKTTQPQKTIPVWHSGKGSHTV